MLLHRKAPGDLASIESDLWIENPGLPIERMEAALATAEKTHGLALACMMGCKLGID
jgi:hypothetical protein